MSSLRRFDDTLLSKEYFESIIDDYTVLLIIGNNNLMTLYLAPSFIDLYIYIYVYIYIYILYTKNWLGNVLQIPTTASMCHFEFFVSELGTMKDTGMAFDAWATCSN